MRTSRQMLKDVRRAWLAAFAFSAFVNVLMLATPLYTLQIFETVVPLGSVETLIIITAITALAILALALIEISRDLILLRASVWLEDQLGSHMLDTGLARGTPAVEMRRNSRALENLRQFLASPAAGVVMDAPFAPVFLIALIALNPIIGTVALISAGLILIVALLQMALTTRLQNESAEARDISDRWLRTATGSSLLTGALGLAGGVVGQWQRANRAHISAAYSQGKRAIFLKSISRTVRIGSQIALYGVGAWLVVKAEIAPGALVASAILLARALAPIEGLAQSIKTIRTAFAAYGQLKALPEDAETALFGDRQSANGTIGLRDVTYYHPQRKTAALRGISLTLATSECVGIVGPNGAGKSTLAAMLAGAIIPTAGVADLDGVAIAKWQRDPGDTPIGYVGDEPLLLEGTVHANIARFRDVALLSVARAAMRAGVHDILQGLEQGYDTPVGQSGTGLALRERRAVAFARALCGTPRVVIFDEPELGLDGAAVKKLIGTLQALKSEGVGLIVVTQDPRLIEIMDRVVVIANGTIQATGPAAEFSRPQGPRVVRPVEAQKGQS